MSPARLILVKHAETALTPEVTAEHWPLTDRGRAQCIPLAQRLAPHAPSRIVSSTEIKAIETGQLVARHLAIPFDSQIGLHEHDRSNVPLVPREQFEDQMRRFFAAPREFVYGRETADEARRRFENAIIRVVREYPGETLAIITHGTVMALLLASPNQQDPFALWQSLAAPSFVVVDAPAWRIVETVASI